MIHHGFNYTEKKEEYIKRIFYFIYDHLCKWRDNCNRPNEENEKLLNADLSQYLNYYVRKKEQGFIFSHEYPQGNNRTVDIAACYNAAERYNEAIIIFECKRLSKKITGKRKDEYITGHDEITGGMQRFKIEVHGKHHKTVGMIGYVQSGTLSEWQDFINSCIDNLSVKPDENGLCWSKQEHLNTIKQDDKNRKCHCKSKHARKTLPEITIHHLWIDMQKEESV